MKTIEDMKLELLSDNSNKFMQTLIDYDIKSKDKYGSNLLHYYIMNYDSIVHPAGVIISEFIKKGLDGLHYIFLFSVSYKIFLKYS